MASTKSRNKYIPKYFMAVRNYINILVLYRLEFSGGVAVIKVGAVTETEIKDKQLSLEDGMNASRAAVEEGIIPGAGATLTHCTSLLTYSYIGELRNSRKFKCKNKPFIVIILILRRVLLKN